jgi:hypothetical protein
MFIVNALKELVHGIWLFIMEFGRGLFIAVKYRLLDVDTKLAQKIPGPQRILIWVAVAVVVFFITTTLLSILAQKILAMFANTATMYDQQIGH